MRHNTRLLDKASQDVHIWRTSGTPSGDLWPTYFKLPAENKSEALRKVWRVYQQKLASIEKHAGHSHDECEVAEESLVLAPIKSLEWRRDSMLHYIGGLPGSETRRDWSSMP